MQTSTREERERDRRLPAPEAEVLLRGPKANDCQILRVAITELVVREAFGLATVTQQRRFGRVRRIQVLTRGRTFDAEAGGSLRAVLDVYRHARPASGGRGGAWSFGSSEGDRAEHHQHIDDVLSRSAAASTPRVAWAVGRAALRDQMEELERAETYADTSGMSGVPVAKLAAAVFRRYNHTGWMTNGTYGYVRKVVRPELARRGLLMPERHWRLGLFPATRWMPTPTGIAAKAEIAERLLPTVPVWRGRGEDGVIGELRARGAFLGAPATVDAIFAAIDAGVRSGWFDVYGD